MIPESAPSAHPLLYLLDVEGTVAPISLVTEQLFPYARKHFAAFLAERADDPSVKADLAVLAEENRAEIDPSAPHIPPQICHPERGRRGDRVEGPAFRTAPSSNEMGAPGPDSGAGDTSISSQPDALPYLNWLMDLDRKSTALKSLQGKIWKAGFESGELKGTLFADVPAALARWSASARVAIYSSGSVEAQQLLFRYSTFGDLTPLIAAYFDTRTGPKTAPASYAAIAAAMKVAPAEAIFFSDVVRELDPAREAGLQTRLVVRPGNAPVEDAHGHWIIDSFDGI